MQRKVVLFEHFFKQLSLGSTNSLMVYFVVVLVFINTALKGPTENCLIKMRVQPEHPRY